MDRMSEVLRIGEVGKGESINLRFRSTFFAEILSAEWIKDERLPLWFRRKTHRQPTSTSM